jgi:hypothetical protein
MSACRKNWIILKSSVETLKELTGMVIRRNKSYSIVQLYLEISLPQDFATSTRPETEFFATEAFLSEDQNFDA